MVTEYMGIGQDTKYCYFQDTFIIFMKEANSDKPYFALKVDNNDILEKIEETDEPKIFDSTTLADREEYYSKYLLPNKRIANFSYSFIYSYFHQKN